MKRSLLAACCAMFFFVAPASAGQTFPFGDVNQSGSVDAVDIQLVINAALGLSIPFDADLNDDSAVNAVDIQLVVNVALGINMGGTFTLTLILDADTIGSNNHNVWVFKSNEGYTRESAPYNNPNILVTRFSADVAVEMLELQFDANDIITLIAFDGNRTVFGAGNVPIDNEASNEFVMWDGDIGQAEVGDLGEAAFRMDRNRTISAIYRRMPLMVISQSTMNANGVSPGCTHISVTIADYLSFPNDVISYNDSTYCGPVGPFLRGQLRTGSTVTLTAQPIGGLPNLQFERWEGGDNCGAGASCTLTAGSAEGAECVWTGAPGG